jgi:hypothetical protein
MLLASIYAIYGNDLRLSFFSAGEDGPFAVLALCCFVLFGVECVLGATPPNSNTKPNSLALALALALTAKLSATPTAALCHTRH